MHTTHTITINKEKSRTDRMYDYECVIAVELQCAVSWHLVECDPQSALRLAAASRQQAMVLDSLLPRLAHACHFLKVAEGATPTAADYVRACVALGGRDARATVLSRLMEGLVRLLFSQPLWARWRGIGEQLRTVPDPCGTGVSLFPIDDVIADSRLGSVRSRAREWYKWLTAGPTDRSHGCRRDTCLVDTVFLDHTNGRSSGLPGFDRAFAVSTRENGRHRWVQLGVGPVPIVPDAAHLVVPFGLHGRGALSLNELAAIVGFDDCYNYDHISSWQARASFGAMQMDADGDIEALLASDGARDAMSDAISSAVGNYTRGVDERLVRSGPLRLPRFADAFAPRLYLVPCHWAVFLAVDMSTPWMDALLAIERPTQQEIQ
ncbi:hypothetical protein pneo_cds_434 [Pandoravirus neocaledonia]|uniref:Uncharacterized protein n=1 Tax=Pandoravirus neocaledonia TaxID=2107708 RepID=A0A2U7UC51_9VIRU|nr:hypothetical protein pneo_cds_434 [Pandoravirus neocaledonia]AVK76041.1 hypothetical protein pneo_cds_434 [Pandoravirus neocaledonia]